MTQNTAAEHGGHFPDKLEQACTHTKQNTHAQTSEESTTKKKRRLLLPYIWVTRNQMLNIKGRRGM